MPNRTLRVPCIDEQAAQAAAVALTEENGLDGVRAVGAHVLVPVSGWDPSFIFGVAEAVADYGIDAELARWAAREAAGLPGAV